MRMILHRSGNASRRLLIAGWLCGTGLSQGATFSVLPSSVSDTYEGRIVLQIGGLSAGETVAFNKYLDANNNGFIDAADWLVQSFRLTDDQASTIGGVTNISVAYDVNATSGAITAESSLLAAGISQTFVGTYLYRLFSPTDHFGDVTNAFTIANAAHGQGFTGQIQCNGTNIPYAGVLVFGNDGQLLGKTVADGSGTYSIQVAPGVYQLGTFKRDYVYDMAAMPSLVLGAGVPITTNMNLIPATQSISGRCVDAGNSSIGLPGMLVVVQSTNDLLAIGFTDTNGTFTVPVTASGWKMGADDQTLTSYGYLSLQDRSPINTTTGSVSGVAIAFPKATALFYGTVKDDQDHPLAALSLNAEDGSGFYSEGQCVTDTNGNYAIAVLAGAWHVKPSNNSPGYDSYLFSGVNTNIADGQAARVDFTGRLSVSISGRVLGNGVPLVDVWVQVGILTNDSGHWQWEYVNSARTDNQGYYSALVPPGIAYAVQYMPQSGDIWLRQYYSNATDEAGAILVTPLIGAPATNINFNLQQGASVSGRVKGGGVRLSGIDVEVGTVTFSGGGNWDWGQTYRGTTDSSGNYSIIVPPGTNYYARGNPPEGAPWLEQFYDHVSDVSSASAFSALTNAPATNINFDLQQGALISGQVLGNGVALDNVWVQVGLLSTNEWGDWQWQYVHSGQTDMNGDYAMAVPPGIAYAVQYMPQSGETWMRQYYSNATHEAGATWVTPLIGAAATHIDFNLQPDVNGNGVPDCWEEGCFGSLAWMTGTSDWDRDGAPDISEYWAGTIPTNNASFLGVVGFTAPVSGSGFIIRWSSVTGKKYRIERASDLRTGFDTTVKAGIHATPAMNTETDTTAGVEGPVFYRVRVETP